MSKKEENDFNLTVSYKNLSVTLNKGMLDRQNCWDNLDRIKFLHKFKLVVLRKMRDTDKSDVSGLHRCRDIVTNIEFKLQEAWGFEANANFHQFWKLPHCDCPELDNMDAYPYRSYVNMSCVLHGSEYEK